MQVVIYNSIDMEPLTTVDLPVHHIKVLREGGEIKLLVRENFDFSNILNQQSETCKMEVVQIYAKSKRDRSFVVLTNDDTNLVKRLHSEYEQEDFEKDLRRAMSTSTNPSPPAATAPAYHIK